jgi:3-oxoacyl-[acyl-carrier-protein] synthase-3
MMKTSVGILGIGTYLPPIVRTNDWWPESVVASWRERRAAPVNERARMEPATPGERLIAAAMAEWREDPFHGAVERRVMKEGMRGSEMEREAATEAIRRADIDPREIGLVLCNTLAPDYLATNNACLLHHNLELAPGCVSLATEAGCNAFMMQLAMAEPFIASGQAKYALLVQTCNISPLLRTDDPLSTWFGDGCAATVVGRVGAGRGLLSQAHRTQGQFHRSIVAGVPGRHWYDEGRVFVYSDDQAAARKSFLGIADSASEVTSEALGKAGFEPADVDFYGAHQASRWFREATQRHLRLTKARYMDTFPWTGSLAGANIPLGLMLAEQEGKLLAGDLVLTFAGGAGLTCSSMLLRWGR